MYKIKIAVVLFVGAIVSLGCGSDVEPNSAVKVKVQGAHQVATMDSSESGRMYRCVNCDPSAYNGLGEILVCFPKCVEKVVQCHPNFTGFEMEAGGPCAANGWGDMTCWHDGGGGEDDGPPEL